MNDMNVSVSEVQMILGQKDIEIYALNRKILMLLKRIEELERPKEDAPQ